MNYRDPHGAGSVVMILAVALLLALCSVSIMRNTHAPKKGSRVSSSQIVPGGFPVPALATVAVDNQSIFGSGTADDPLRTGSGGGGTFRATFVSLGQPIPGMAVVGSVAEPDPGTVASVTPGDATDGTQASAQVLGLIASINEDGSVQVQSSGPLTLTVAQWNAARGGAVGGLVPTEPFYLSVAGKLDDVPATNPGDYSVQVGVAINATTLILSCPAVPIGPHA